MSPAWCGTLGFRGFKVALYTVLLEAASADPASEGLSEGADPIKASLQAVGLVSMQGCSWTRGCRGCDA